MSRFRESRAYKAELHNCFNDFYSGGHFPTDLQDDLDRAYDAAYKSRKFWLRVILSGSCISLIGFQFTVGKRWSPGRQVALAGVACTAMMLGIPFVMRGEVDRLRGEMMKKYEGVLDSTCPRLVRFRLPPTV